MKLNLVILLACALCSFGFTQKPENADKSAKQTYEEYIGINIKRCVQALVDSGNDREESYQRCKYALEKAYKIDSTFFKMNPDETQKFIEKHMDELKK